MQVGTASLNDETDDNEEIKELKNDDAELWDEMEVAVEAFVTRCDVIAMVGDEKKKAIAAMSRE